MGPKESDYRNAVKKEQPHEKIGVNRVGGADVLVG